MVLDYSALRNIPYLFCLFPCHWIIGLFSLFFLLNDAVMNTVYKFLVWRNMYQMYFYIVYFVNACVWGGVGVGQCVLKQLYGIQRTSC